MSLKKQNDARMGNASYDTFLQMKQNGELEDSYDLLNDKKMQDAFLQWGKRGQSDKNKIDNLMSNWLLM